MSNIKTIGIAVILSVLFSFGVVSTQKTHTETKTVVREVPLAAASSPDLPGRYFSFGGVRNWGGKTSALTSATTTICSFQSPASTSTLLQATLRLDTSTTVTSIIQFSKNTVNNGTSSTGLLSGNYTVAANAKAFIQASTTPTGTAVVFEPNAWLNVVVAASGGVQTVSPTGLCQATFQES